MSEPVAIALVGAGTIGTFHAETLARRVPGARLAALADPNEAAMLGVRSRLGLDGLRCERDYQALLADPGIEAVVVASPGRTHPEVVTAAAQAGKHVFCEKPLGHSLEAADRALSAVDNAKVLLQVGFQRRFDPSFARAHELADDGSLGSIHLLRSLTRDPEIGRPEVLVPWEIFLETMIHDFDVLRWLAASEPVEIYAMADALIAPEYRSRGLLDTALVAVRFENGALATADASFQAVYGYDVRAEVFGSLGMVTVGDGRIDSTWHYGPDGASRQHIRGFLERFQGAYTAELQHFARCVRAGAKPLVSGNDGRASLAMALAAVRSFQTRQPVGIEG